MPEIWMPGKPVVPTKEFRAALPDGKEALFAGAECLADWVAYALCRAVGKDVVPITYRTLDVMEKVMMAYSASGNIAAIITMLGAIPGLEVVEQYYNLALAYERMALNIYGAYVNLLRNAVENFVEAITGKWPEFLKENPWILQCSGVQMIFELIEVWTNWLVSYVEGWDITYKRALRWLEELGTPSIVNHRYFTTALTVIRYTKAVIQRVCPDKIG
jgi:hypothetical protein